MDRHCNHCVHEVVELPDEEEPRSVELLSTWVASEHQLLPSIYVHRPHEKRDYVLRLTRCCGSIMTLPLRQLENADAF